MGRRQPLDARFGSSGRTGPWQLAARDPGFIETAGRTGWHRRRCDGAFLGQPGQKPFWGG